MSHFDLVSWNLNGLETGTAVPRAELAIQEILLGQALGLENPAKPVSPPQIILLQEVIRTSFEAVLKPHLGGIGYRLFPDSAPDRNYFEAIATHPGLSVVRQHSEPLYRSQYGRWLHQVEVEQDAAQWSIFTAHFDSGKEELTSTIRRSQLRDVADRMGPLDVFAGDTNLRDREVSGEIEVQDAWEKAGKPASLRRTWPSHPARGKGGARFDRCWFGKGWSLRAFDLLGNSPATRIDGTGVSGPPSDHLGLRVQLQRV